MAEVREKGKGGAGETTDGDHDLNMNKPTKLFVRMKELAQEKIRKQMKMKDAPKAKSKAKKDKDKKAPAPAPLKKKKESLWV